MAGLGGDVVHNIHCTAKVDAQDRVTGATSKNVGDLVIELSELVVRSCDLLVAKRDGGKGVEALKDKPYGCCIGATVMAAQYCLWVSVVKRPDVQPWQRLAGIGPVGLSDPALIKVIQTQIRVRDDAGSMEIKVCLAGEIGGDRDVVTRITDRPLHSGEVENRSSYARGERGDQQRRTVCPHCRSFFSERNQNSAQSLPGCYMLDVRVDAGVHMTVHFLHTPVLTRLTGCRYSLARQGGRFGRL